MAADTKEPVDDEKPVSKDTDAITTDSDRKETVDSSSILEKGQIYFFFRPRVAIEDPKGLEDIARTHLVLRPLPASAKIGDGTIQEDCRLIALPKKVLPKGSDDRFM
jgi:hypothetical protein